MPIVDELITLLGFKTDTKDAKKMVRSMKDVKKSIKTAALGMTAFVGGIAYMTKKIANSVDENNLFSKAIRMDFEKLQELQFAAEAVGGSVEEMNSDLASLTQTMSSPIPGEFNNELLMLGVNIRKSNGSLKTAGDVLGDLSLKFEKMSDQRAFQWGKKLGLSNTTIELLKKGKEGLAALRKESRDMGALIPKKNLEDVRESNKLYAELSRTIKGIIQTFVISFLPVVNKTMSKMKDWLVENREQIKSTMKTLSEEGKIGLSWFMSWVEKAWEKFKQFINYVKEETKDIDFAFEFKNMVGYIKQVRDDFAKFVNFLENAEKIVKRISEEFKILKGFVNTISLRTPEQDKGFFGNIKEFYGLGSSASKPKLDMFGTARRNAPTNTTNNSSGTNILNQTVNVNGAGNPRATGDAVLDKTLSASERLQQMQSGINAPSFDY